jgi:TRAP-type C4-dicarboxylate transport system permease small subunit
MSAPSVPNRTDPLAPLARASIALAAAAVLGLVAVQAWQVVARYLLNASPGWTEPVATLLLVAAMSFGAAAAVHARAHFAFGLLAQSAAPALRRGLEAISHAIQAMIGAMLTWWSARLLVDGLDIRMAGAPLPQSANFAPLLLGGALITLFALHSLWQTLGGRDSGAGSEPN